MLEILKSSLLVKWGRWFLQIVDIHVGNLNMKLTGRWFPQIVDRDSGNLYPIYIYHISPYISQEIYPRTKYYTDNSSYTRVTPSGKKLYRNQVEFSKFGRTMTRQW